MREHKFRYFWQHDETGRMTSRELTLGDITCGAVDEHTEKIGYGVPIITGIQYTGLKDKNGVEIYEGDIIKWSTGEVAKVVWWEGDAEYVAETIVDGEEYIIITKDQIENADFGSFQEEPILNGFQSSKTAYHEVIGNIYENPELL